MHKKYKRKSKKTQSKNHLWYRLTGRAPMEDWLVIAVLVIVALVVLMFLQTDLWTKVATLGLGGGASIWSYIKKHLLRK